MNYCKELRAERTWLRQLTHIMWYLHVLCVSTSLVADCNFDKIKPNPAHTPAAGLMLVENLAKLAPSDNVLHRQQVP